MARFHKLIRAAGSLLAAPLVIGASEAGRLQVELHGLRNAAGEVRLCLTRAPKTFPDCARDPQARTLDAPAGAAKTLHFADLPSGSYALAVFHDENRNRRLDTFARIPREGFGFSRNPPIRFGPPSFAEARFTVSGEARQVVTMKYIL